MFTQALDLKKNDKLSFDPSKIKNVYVYAFEDVKKDEKKKQEVDEKLLSDLKYTNLLHPLDAFLELEKTDLKAIRDQEFENYHEDIMDKVANLQLL